MSGILTIEGGSVLEANYGYPDLNFTVRLSAPSSETVSVHYRTSGNGTATEYIDYYNAVSGTLIFAPGETEKVFSVEVDGDYDEEADESIAVELYDPVNAGLEGGARFLGALGWILDDDGVNQKRALGVSNPVVIEGDAGNRDAVFTVSLSRALSTDQDLHYETRDVTASAGEDYLSRTGTLRILAGQTEATVRVPVIGDRAAESSGSFELVVTPGPDFTRTGFAHVGMATILDDDSGGLRPTISLEGARATEEAYGNNYLVYTVRLSSSYGDTVAVDYAFEPGTATKDYDFDDSYR